MLLPIPQIRSPCI